MKIIDVFKNYNSNEKCIELLERTRWEKGITCPYCQSMKVSTKSEKNRSDRHQCQSCHKSFTVTVGTIFHSAKKLPEWFQVLALMLNAKKSLSSHQIARDLNLTQPNAWNIQKKIRKAMQTEESELLQGLVEMDEVYIGGKPRHNIGMNIPGRGTDKTPVVGMVERGGRVRTEVVPKDTKLGFKTQEGIVKRNINKMESLLIIDEYKGCQPMGGRGGIAHAVINHKRAYVQGLQHTNTIEGFWSLLKRAWYGSHHHYSRDNAHLYVGETQYKYNNRKNNDMFLDTIRRILQ